MKTVVGRLDFAGKKSCATLSKSSDRSTVKIVAAKYDDNLHF